MNEKIGPRVIDEQEFSEIEFLGQLARTRLEEDPYTSESMAKLLSGDIPEKLPICIGGEFWGRWIGSNVAQFYEDPVIRFKSICAGIIRFRADMVSFFSHGLALAPLIKYFGAKPTDLGSGVSPFLFEDHPVKEDSDVEGLKIPTSGKLEEILSDHLWYASTERRLLGNSLGPRIYYLIDPLAFAGGALRGMDKIMLDMVKNPSLVHELCEVSTKILAKIGRFEKRNGVEVICTFGVASFLSPNQCEEFLIPYLESLLKAFHPCKLYVGGMGNMSHIIDHLMKLDCDGLMLDSETPVPKIIDAFNKFDKRCFRHGVNRKVMITGSIDEIEKNVVETVNVARKVASPILSDFLDYRITFENADFAVSKARKLNYGGR